MVRCGVLCSACKADLALLPPLVRRLRRLPFTAQHAQQYNDLIEVRGTILHACKTDAVGIGQECTRLRGFKGLGWSWCAVRNPPFFIFFNAASPCMHACMQRVGMTCACCACGCGTWHRICGMWPVLCCAVWRAPSRPAPLQSVRRNLLTSDWWDEDHSQSLMSARNAKWARQMMGNVRLACCVAGACRQAGAEARSCGRGGTRQAVLIAHHALQRCVWIAAPRCEVSVPCCVTYGCRRDAADGEARGPA